jgi:hypothetical protein
LSGLTSPQACQEKTESGVGSADGVRRDPPCLEGDSGRADSDVEHTKIWALVTKFTDEFILVLFLLRAYNEAVDLKHRALRMDEADLSLWRSGTQSRLFPLTMVNDEVIPDRCERVVTAGRRRPRGTKFEGTVEGTAPGC